MPLDHCCRLCPTNLDLDLQAVFFIRNTIWYNGVWAGEQRRLDQMTSTSGGVNSGALDSSSWGCCPRAQVKGDRLKISDKSLEKFREIDF